ncbi:hypothetical protein MRBBS_3584 [Marinobacter sp. BSs20148]|nr:hypothetical protein MRBBS_3584 [Marinobacter sp. BSs20148]
MRSSCNHLQVEIIALTDRFLQYGDLCRIYFNFIAKIL